METVQTGEMFKGKAAISENLSKAAMGRRMVLWHGKRVNRINYRTDNTDKELVLWEEGEIRCSEVRTSALIPVPLQSVASECMLIFPKADLIPIFTLVDLNRNTFDSWVKACHRVERRVRELQREVDKLKMEKDVLEEETRAVTDERNELHNQLPQLHQNFGPQPAQPQKRPLEEDGEMELIQLAKDRSTAMKDLINMLFDQSMDLDFKNASP
ncbi:hypothetical protein BT69DRAFT_1322507 [Atractiella rhizophila]|nr:hypothetical protein BT69DRAFT_1322507 [Atractiella rhizophila]